MSFFPYLILCFCVVFSYSADPLPVGHGSAPDEYIIIPKALIGRQAAQALGDLINSLVADPTRVYASLIPPDTVPEFWVATLDGAAYERLRREPNVSV